jgi:hypothetical protein
MIPGQGKALEAAARELHAAGEENEGRTFPPFEEYADDWKSDARRAISAYLAALDRDALVERMVDARLADMRLPRWGGHRATVKHAQTVALDAILPCPPAVS